MISTRNLFIITFIGILVVYSIFLTQDKILEIIKDNYLFIVALIPITGAYLFLKFKLKDYELINFNKNSSFSLKTTVVFFLVFQVIDYIYEDGFIGMISQWFLYWIMGLIGLLLIENINYYKNYKLIK